jgi:hypothetical protein
VAAAAGGGLLYRQVTRFDPGDRPDGAYDDGAGYAAHQGEIGSVRIAFCASNPRPPLGANHALVCELESSQGELQAFLVTHRR